MKSTLVVCLIVTLFVTISLCDDRPRKVPHISTNCGSSCPVNCKNREPRICPTRCVARSICPEGYYENDNSECVVPEDC